MDSLIEKLENFKADHKMNTKGPLCLALHVTRYAKEHEFPIDESDLLTPNHGQVKGLGHGRIQSILSDYGITRILANEGGRTTRGNIEKSEIYSNFLNELYQTKGFDIDTVEKWWIDQVIKYFASMPFKLKLDSSKSFKSIISDLLDQAADRQSEGQGTMVVGAVLQHLVGAKLDLILGPGNIEHHGSSVADSPTGRPGDFILDDVAVHVTAAPGEALIRKCRDNINSSLKPIIVTISNKTNVAEELASQSDLKDRIDVFEIEQFMAANVYEFSRFSKDLRPTTVQELIERYNTIVGECESDPGLKIKIT